MRLFKNATAYKIVSPIEGLENLIDSPPKELGDRQVQSFGWTNPDHGRDSEAPVNDLNENLTLLCMVKIEKKLKASAVNREVKKRIANIQGMHLDSSAKIGHKERLAIKDEVIFDSLPNTLPQESRTYAYIDLKNNLLVIDQASVKRCDEFTAALRDAIGSLPVVPVACAGSPANTMSDWLSNDSQPPSLELMGSAKFISKLDESQNANIKHVDLDSSCVSGIIKDGMIPKDIALRRYDGSGGYIDFTVTDSAIMKSIKFSDECLDDCHSDDGLDFHAMALINCHTITSSLNEMFELFGGIGE